MTLGVSFSLKCSISITLFTLPAVKHSCLQYRIVGIFRWSKFSWKSCFPSRRNFCGFNSHKMHVWKFPWVQKFTQNFTCSNFHGSYLWSLFSHFGYVSRKSRKFGPRKNFPLYAVESLTHEYVTKRTWRASWVWIPRGVDIHYLVTGSNINDYVLVHMHTAIVND